MKTIKEIAEICGVTKQTIRNRITKMGADGRLQTEVNNGVTSFVVPDDLAVEIYHQLGIKTPSIDSVDDKFSDKIDSDLSKALTVNRQLISHLEDEVAFLKNQIELKDKQIEALTAALLSVGQKNTESNEPAPGVQQETAQKPKEPIQAPVPQIRKRRSIFDLFRRS